MIVATATAIVVMMGDQKMITKLSILSIVLLIGSISIINVQAESTLKDLNQDGLFMDDMYIDENGTVQGVKTDFA